MNISRKHVKKSSFEQHDSNPPDLCSNKEQSITLPVLQSEKWRGFPVNFQGSPLPRNKTRKVLENFRENSEHFSEPIRDKNSKNSRFFRFVPFLTLTDADPIENDMSARKSHIAIRERIIGIVQT